MRMRGNFFTKRENRNYFWRSRGRLRIPASVKQPHIIILQSPPARKRRVQGWLVHTVGLLQENNRCALRLRAGGGIVWLCEALASGPTLAPQPCDVTQP
jgi:hypothetical protein